MASVIRSALSEQDRREIWRYIAADNADAADRLISRIDNKLTVYAENPGMGTAREDLRDGLRSFPAGNYLVFYRIVPDAIELVRVLHGARDLKSLFE